MEATITKRPTKDEHRQHLIEGMDGKPCLVCGDADCAGYWTDLNGQMKCIVCGATYQIISPKLSDNFLSELGLTKEQVARKYCDCFQIVPLLRDYWQETKQPIPLGCYLGKSPINREHHVALIDWLRVNADKYATEFAKDFRWDRIRETETAAK